MRKAHVVLTMVLAAATMAPARRTTLEDVKQLLLRPVIGPDLGQAEVAAFCEKRVPRMPKVSSVAEWEAHAKRIRRDVLNNVVFRGPDAKRWRDYKAKVEWLDTIEGGPGYKIKKLRYEAVPGYWIPALLYQPDKVEGKHAVFLNVNGHDGNGKAAPYKQIRSINMAKRGIVVLNVEWIGMGQLRGQNHYQMNQMDACGTSGLSVFYLAMRRGLDVLMKLPNVDTERVGVSGLSGGGWQTIFLSSLDERVTLCNPVAGYSSFITRANVTRDLGDSEQTPNDLATVADYVHLTAMRAPRPTLITGNDKDNCCFQPQDGFPELLGGAGPIYKLYGKERALQTHVNSDPGTHNYERDNREALYRFIGEHWRIGDGKEIPSDGEVKTAEQLAVPLPEGNATLHTLATRTLDSARQRRPASKPDDLAWRRKARADLAKLVRLPKYDAVAEKAGEATAGETRAVYWKLKIGGEWTVPAVELSRGNPRLTSILLASGPRTELAAQIEADLQRGRRVIVADLFFFGESKIKFGADFLYVLLMHAVGQRALGVQAAQTIAIRGWAEATFGAEPVIEAVGERTPLIALVAKALSPGLQIQDGIVPLAGNLDNIVIQDRTVDKYPEQFCFGLLEKFDVPRLKALAARE